MSRDNVFDSQVDHLVAGMKKRQDQLSEYSKDVKPYRSTELNPEEDAQFFREPWRLFPGEDSLIQPGAGRLTAPEAYARALQEMGPVKYAKWWDSHVG